MSLIHQLKSSVSLWVLMRVNTKKTENPFWLSISDLMSGLLMVFMLLTIIMLYQVSQTVQTKARIYSLLEKRLNAAGHSDKADVDRRSGTITIADKILFDSGKYNIKRAGQQYLNWFIPIISETIFTDEKAAKEVYAIDIEGYTSEIRANKKSMMDLSLKRSYSVWKYIYYSKQIPYKQKLLKKLKVCGWGNMKASSRRDLKRDRKVVFQLQFKGFTEKLEDALSIVPDRKNRRKQ